ncbi:glycosyltransferase family protein [Acuticoccus mangrovi]|uniref:Glycosyltransferase n=1 Tax=Acuticoccus mangrovi TaxID=2796142 RepID=A0A934MHQ2_9HYPH|nr:glycosyltransferase [Acuticoccus mangrovi]
MTRVLIWVQHLLGTGHTVRAAAIGHALAARGTAVTLVLGARPPATLGLAGLDVVQLPPVLATDGSFTTILGEDGRPYADWQPARRAAFDEVVRSVRPDAVLTETFPLGRRAFAGEIVPALASLKGRVPIAASVRDVLVRKSAAKEAAMAALVSDWFDMVLVHADPAFVRLEESFGATAAFAERIRYTGFVHAPAPPVSAGDGEGEILVSSGGGGVGAALVEAAIGAARLTPGRDWRILTSPQLGDRLSAWRRAAPAGVTLEPNRPDFRSLLARAELSVSQAGYNTVLDVLIAGVRAVLVPFAAHEETEQSDRAAALARRGLAEVIDEDALTTERLASAVAASFAAPPPPRPAIDVDGAARTAEILLAAAKGG